MPHIDWEQVNARKRELRREGVITRARIIAEEFPEVAARGRALTSRRLETRLWEIAPPVTEDPDHGEGPPPHPFGGLGGNQ